MYYCCIYELDTSQIGFVIGHLLLFSLTLNKNICKSEHNHATYKTFLISRCSAAIKPIKNLLLEVPRGYFSLLKVKKASSIDACYVRKWFSDVGNLGLLPTFSESHWPFMVYHLYQSLRGFCCNIIQIAGESFSIITGINTKALLQSRISKDGNKLTAQLFCLWRNELSAFQM